MKGDKSRERAAKQAAREHAERRKSNWLLAGVAALMVAGVVADVSFIRWQRHQRHLRHEQRQNMTNSVAKTNGPPASGRKTRNEIWNAAPQQKKRKTNEPSRKEP